MIERYNESIRNIKAWQKPIKGGVKALKGII